jgi:putative pyruvate formate lyase activating enzyme
LATPVFEPAYLRLLGAGELAQRARDAYAHLEECDLCARYCRMNRRRTIRGAVCRTGERAVVSSFGPHHGEENPLRGTGGSGTIFFSWCNLRCSFCQNWEISQKGIGREVEPEEMAAMMLELQDHGCHNINFVSPSHTVPQILAAVEIAAKEGLRLPLVYNTGGYDSPEALALLDGVIDIYMPDMKYGDSETAHRYSHVRNYWEVNQTAVLEMHRQVGDLLLDDRGVALRGLLVRHLILPDGLANSEKVFTFIAQKISSDTYINVMDQYSPGYRAGDIRPLDRPVGREEVRQALLKAEKCGLHRLDERRRWSLRL